MLLFALFLLIVIYFILAILAICWKHRNAPSICILNFFLGWTFIGWVIALVLAYKVDVPQGGLASAPATVAGRLDDLAFLADLREQQKAKPPVHCETATVDATKEEMTNTKRALVVSALALLAAVAPARAQSCAPEARQGITRSGTKSALETDPPTDKALVYVMLPSGRFLPEQRLG